ncbi:MAG TPA: hypothetical protein VF407_04140 [Polyangiaceae bacterium]
MNRFVVNVSEYPIVAVIYPEKPTLREASELFDFYADLAKAGARVGYTIDMRRFDPVVADAKTRKMVFDLFKKHEAALSKSTVCEARIAPSAVTRGVLTAFDWMTGTKWPCTNVKNAADAVAWVKGHLAAEGLDERAKAPPLSVFSVTPDGVVRFAA